MAHLTRYPHQSVMTFIDMRIKQTDSSWSFHNDQEVHPPILLHDSSISKLHSSQTRVQGPTHDMQIKCVWREKNANPNPTCKIARKFPGRYRQHVFYPKVQVQYCIKHTTIYIPGYAPALQIKIHGMQYIQKAQYININSSKIINNICKHR